jgi:hypothetical protein
MPKHIFLTASGLPTAPRMCIMDDNNNYWSEMDNCWTTDPTRAALYIDTCDAGHKLRELMLSQVPGKLYSFIVPLKIEIKTTNPISITAVQEWLATHVRFDFGDEEENALMAVIQVDFNKVEQTIE